MSPLMRFSQCVFKCQICTGILFSLTLMKKTSGAFHIEVTVEPSENSRVDRTNGYFKI